MSYLVDTNILIRAFNDLHPSHVATNRAVEKLVLKGEQICVLPQNLIEFWAVATRPVSVNGLGLTIDETIKNLTRIKNVFVLSMNTSAIYGVWEQLVIKYQVVGKPTHDAHLVAGMIVHGIDNILTFNLRDFQRYTEITAVDPASIS